MMLCQSKQFQFSPNFNFVMTFDRYFPVGEQSIVFDMIKFFSASFRDERPTGIALAAKKHHWRVGAEFFKTFKQLLKRVDLNCSHNLLFTAPARH